MSNYNSTLQSNNTDLQAILNTINELPSAGGEQATPVISVSSNGLITAVAGTKSATKQLAFQPAKTITPTTTSQTAVSSGYYTGGAVTVAGDSNLVAGNIKSGVSIFGVTGTHSGGGNTDFEDGIITGKFSGSYYNDRVVTIKEAAFMDCSYLTSVNFPNVYGMGESAFCYCTSLSTANFENFDSRIPSYAFCGCRALQSVSFPQASAISASAFGFCSSLSSVYFPSVTYLATAAFSGCYNLQTASFPKLTKISSSRVFMNCRNLSSFILASTTVCTLSKSDSFGSTPYAGYSAYFSGTPYIYVPRAKISAYQAATNWTYFSSYFSAIEDMPK